MLPVAGACAVPVYAAGCPDPVYKTLADFNCVISMRKKVSEWDRRMGVHVFNNGVASHRKNLDNPYWDRLYKYYVEASLSSPQPRYLVAASEAILNSINSASNPTPNYAAMRLFRSRRAYNILTVALKLDESVRQLGAGEKRLAQKGLACIRRVMTTNKGRVRCHYSFVYTVVK